MLGSSILIKLNLSEKTKKKRERIIKLYTGIVAAICALYADYTQF